MTEKLYDDNAYLTACTAHVRSCVTDGGGWKILLDRTVFFPTEGGQSADTGTLGGLAVTDARLAAGEVWHYTAAPLPEGEEVHVEIDWPARLRKMQHHTAEHIVSGLFFSRYGLHNVGFHLGHGDVTLDLDAPLPPHALEDVEWAANEAVRACLTVSAAYPTPQELAQMTYRSKITLTEGVRIVTVPGYDRCACCAPHVGNTGEIGCIRLTGSLRYKGGVRIHLLAGAEAITDARAKEEELNKMSVALSVPPLETAAALDRMQQELFRLRGKCAALRREALLKEAQALPWREGNLCYFGTDLDATLLRTFAEEALSRCTGICAAFCGSDGTGYRYVMAGHATDMRALQSDMNAKLQAHGGGSSEMIQGQCMATRKDILQYFSIAEET